MIKETKKKNQKEGQGPLFLDVEFLPNDAARGFIACTKFSAQCNEKVNEGRRLMRYSSCINKKLCSNMLS